MGTATTPNIGAFGTAVSVMRGTRYSGSGYKQPKNNNNNNNNNNDWGFWLIVILGVIMFFCLTSCDKKQKELIVHTSDKYKVTTLIHLSVTLFNIHIEIKPEL